MLKRIHMHWTAGADGIIPIESDHYNFIVDRNGKVHDGEHPPEHQTPTNVKKGSKFYAAHTLNANSNAIGIAMDAMALAEERPFKAGKYPITPVQVEAFCKFIAYLCKRYDIPVTRGTVLTHAEVQGTLGIKQKNKWDITWLPGMAEPQPPVFVGDILRSKVSGYVNMLNFAPAKPPAKTPVSQTPIDQNKTNLGAKVGFAAFIGLILGALNAVFKKG